MRKVRQGMIEGKPPPECSKCWLQESQGAFSRRMGKNAQWKPLLAHSDVTAADLKKSSDPLEEIKAKAVRDDFLVQSGPVSLELEVGNVCNLKCRMCYPIFSSKIQNDPVHSKWYDTPNTDSRQEKSKANVFPFSRLPEKKHWFKEKTFIYGELIKQPKSIRSIIFKGGEPFVSQEALDILAYLSKEGDPGQLSISIVTNGTIADKALLNNTAQFRKFNLAVSLDGVGSHYEYIRYPAKWSTVEANMRTFSELSNVSLMTSITFQAYNALQIVELFRFCDRSGYHINVNALVSPSFLAASVIPPKARKVAVDRIREYVASECKEESRESISTLATELEAVGDEIDMENLSKFMLFTNDLDQSRNQHFREVHTELLGYIEEAGIPWNEETRFAARQDPLTPVINSTLTMTEV